LDHAPASPKITWRLAHAEERGIESSTVDLITVAQALHWFDFDRYWPEVRRVLKPEGVIAAWCYGVFELDDPSIQAVCDHFHQTTVDAHWPPERSLVEEGYCSILFPFTELPPPSFTLEVDWSMEQLLGHFASWSATARYRQAKGHDPIPALRQVLSLQFTQPAIRVRWPLSLLVGRM
jgi:ubiquinone/menaquinone biosynthesis C-methylase UbiE